MRTGAWARAAATAERACRAGSLRRLPCPRWNDRSLDIALDLCRTRHATEDVGCLFIGRHELCHRPALLGDDNGHPARAHVFHDLEAARLELAGGDLLHGLSPRPMVMT